MNETGQFLLNNKQIGFRAGMGCELNILRIVETIRRKLVVRKQRKLWSMYVDLKSAFDTVDHNLLFYKMDQLGISSDLTNTIKWMYKQTKFWVNEEEIPIGAGVIQGGVLSPSLFLIMFNDLIEELDQLKYDVFAYADDLAIVDYNMLRLTKCI